METRELRKASQMSPKGFSTLMVWWFVGRINIEVHCKSVKETLFRTYTSRGVRGHVTSSLTVTLECYVRTAKKMELFL